MKYCYYCMNESAGDICPHCGRVRTDHTPKPYVISPGTLLNDRYLIGACIGEGGFGITYIARDTLLDIRVAAKEYYPSGVVSRNTTTSEDVLIHSSSKAKKIYDKGIKNFLSEARLLAKFSAEPGIVSVKDFFETNQTAYIIMEYLDGETLKEYLERVNIISYDNAICLLMPVMESLLKLHKSNLLHRDISPDNIMLSDSGIKLLDFGSAREFDYDDEKSMSIVLKHGYAPAEQYRRHGEQGPWTDIYAICAVMYKCITGVVPDSSIDRMYEDTVKPPSALGIEIGKSFEQVLMKGLAIRVEDRYKTIDDLLDAFSLAFDEDDEGQKEAVTVPDPQPAAPAQTSSAPTVIEEPKETYAEWKKRRAQQQKERALEEEKKRQEEKQRNKQWRERFEEEEKFEEEKKREKEEQSKEYQKELDKRGRGKNALSATPMKSLENMDYHTQSQVKSEEKKEEVEEEVKEEVKKEVKVETEINYEELKLKDKKIRATKTCTVYFKCMWRLITAYIIFGVLFGFFDFTLYVDAEKWGGVVFHCAFFVFTAILYFINSRIKSFGLTESDINNAILGTFGYYPGSSFLPKYVDPYNNSLDPVLLNSIYETNFNNLKICFTLGLLTSAFFSIPVITNFMTLYILWGFYSELVSLKRRERKKGNGKSGLIVGIVLVLILKSIIFFLCAVNMQ